MVDEIRKQSLISELAESREQLSDRAAWLRQDLSLGEKIKQWVRKNPAAWIAAAAVAGLLLSRITGKSQKIKVKLKSGADEQVKKIGVAAFAFPFVKLALDTAKPAIISFVKRRAAASRIS